MCCVITVLLLLGPRAAILVWWLLNPPLFQRAFETWVWPVVGVLFAPWTLMAYLIVFPGGVTGSDWIWIGLGILLDLIWHGGAGIRHGSRRYR